jgi:hypothetical protein
MLTREPHPRTLRKNRAVLHCRLALDHRRACLFDPLVLGERSIRYDIFAGDVFELPSIAPLRWIAVLEPEDRRLIDFLFAEFLSMQQCWVPHIPPLGAPDAEKGGLPGPPTRNPAKLMDPLPSKAISSVPELASRTPFAFVVDSLLVRATDYCVGHRDR